VGEVVRLSARARRWRLAAAGAVLGLLAYGTVWGDDDHFPFGPMVQYAFAADPDGTVGDLFVEADDAAGRRVRVVLSPQGAGIVRAEVEGQLDRIRRDPSWLQALADAHARLHPGEPRYVRLHVRITHTRLRDGTVAGVEDVATWDVR
jgi:hypothetical protein